MTGNLGDVQRNFLAFLRGDSSRIANAVAAGPRLTACRGRGNISVEKRLGIYHHAYRARLTEAMQDVFERTWAYLGDESFACCARDFIVAHPPAGRTLHGFGARFPAWLASEFPADGEIADLATIDWLMRRAFDGRDAKPVAQERFALLSAEDWATVRFGFHPTMHIAPLAHNAASQWEALEKGKAPPPAMRLAEPTWLLVWRKAWQPHFITIGEIEAAAIERLRHGVAFAEACEALALQFPGHDIARQTGVALRRWIEDQLLVSVQVS